MTQECHPQYCDGCDWGRPVEDESFCLSWDNQTVYSPYLGEFISYQELLPPEILPEQPVYDRKQLQLGFSVRESMLLGLDLRHDLLIPPPSPTLITSTDPDSARKLILDIASIARPTSHRDQPYLHILANKHDDKFWKQLYDIYEQDLPYQDMHFHDTLSALSQFIDGTASADRNDPRILIIESITSLASTIGLDRPQRANFSTILSRFQSINLRVFAIHNPNEQISNTDTFRRAKRNYLQHLTKNSFSTHIWQDPSHPPHVFSLDSHSGPISFYPPTTTTPPPRPSNQTPVMDLY